MLKISKVHLKYNNHKVLNSVSIDFSNINFCCIIGLSGAGKTSLLKLLNFLIQPSKGTITTNEYGKLINEKQVLKFRKQTAMIFQHNRLIPRFNVLENVLMGKIYNFNILRSYILFSKKEKIKALGCLDKVGLLYCSTNRIDEISGGEIQRVCIARAIYQNPKLLIADEPISQLDPKNAIKIMELFKYISQKKKYKDCNVTSSTKTWNRIL